MNQREKSENWKRALVNKMQLPVKETRMRGKGMRKRGRSSKRPKKEKERLKRHSKKPKLKSHREVITSLPKTQMKAGSVSTTLTSVSVMLALTAV